MLPTPSTSHINPSLIYEPAEDSYLLLDTLSSASESAFLKQRFLSQGAVPLILEVGTGSGVVLAFVAAHAKAILGRETVLVLGGDVNVFACEAAGRTVLQACAENVKNSRSAEGKQSRGSAALLGMLWADLTTPLRRGAVDVLVFNPPYVPSEDVPNYGALEAEAADGAKVGLFEHDSHLLSLSYEGGVDGMEVTNRLLEQLPEVLDPERGVAYVLLCQQNRPEVVMQKIRTWGHGWSVEVVGSSGKKAGWEKLLIIRIWRSCSEI